MKLQGNNGPNPTVSSICGRFCVLALILINLTCSDDPITRHLLGPEIGIDDTTTTSHGFSFRTFTLGNGPSIVNDVAIINDTMAIAVGFINKNDSLGRRVEPPFNIARWDGRTWTLDSIGVKYPDGFYDVEEMSSILAFSEKDIIVSTGGKLFHWDGKKWTLFWDLMAQVGPIGSAFKLWGRSSKDFYAIGKGSIIHWNGSGWQKLDSHTTMTMQDIWGEQNPRTGADEVYCLACEQDSFLGKKVIKIEGLLTSEMDTTGLSPLLAGIWCVPGKKYYIVGSSVFWKSDIRSSESWTKQKPGEIIQYYGEAIRGTAWNDIFITGGYGGLSHFNGKTWTTYSMKPIIAFWRLAFKGNMVIAVGNYGQIGGIAVGTRH